MNIHQDRDLPSAFSEHSADPRAIALHSHRERFTRIGRAAPILQFAGFWMALAALQINALGNEPASGENSAPVTAPDVPKADPKQPASAPSGLPTLDDVLGTDGAKATPTKTPDSPKDASPTDADDVLSNGLSTSDKDLDRRLSAQELGDQFQQAIMLMADAAERLERSKDAGLNTQRVQEDVLRKLDELIAQLEKNSQQQQQQSSSSAQQQQRDPSQSQQQQAKKKAQSKSQKRQQGDPSEQADGPPLQEGALRPALESAPAAWGSLPARVRDMLMQGAGDRFSKAWGPATEAYYRRLAEEQPAGGRP